MVGAEVNADEVTWTCLSPDRRRAQDLETLQDGSEVICTLGRLHPRDEMFMATDTAWAPWFVTRSDDNRRARLNIIEHLLANIPYERVPRAKVKLPARHVAATQKISRLPLKVVAEVH